MKEKLMNGVARPEGPKQSTSSQIASPQNTGLAMTINDLPRLAVLAGPAGIGKTHFLLENFSRLLSESPEPFRRDLLFILPSAEHRERVTDLMLRKDRKGFFGERVVTFNRLMQELLKAGDWALVTDAERKFILEEIVREKAGEYFSAVRDLPGFLEKIAEFIGELKDSLISLEGFRKRAKALQKAQPEIAGKYAALLQMVESYETRLETLGAKDHRDGIFLLKETPPREPKFRHLFLDGFFDFSRAQLEFLSWLRESSERVTLALTLDLSKSRRGLFEIPLQTLRELEKIGFETVDFGGGKNHRTASETLRHVEKNIFKSSVGAPFMAPDEVMILEATGVRGEVEMIAREIRKLMRRGDSAGRPYHCSDIAVILRRVANYEGILRTVFREFQIPVEIHERERLRDSPLAKTLGSFFRVLLEDWKREDLFNFLKSGYVERDYHEVCSLELGGFGRGILSGREKWLKELPHPLFEKLDAFQARTLGEKPVEEWIRFTREAVRSFGLDQILPVYEEKARRDFAALRRFDSLFEEMRRTGASAASGLKSFQAFAREFLGLIEVDLFSLHERDKNRVQVYDVSLARQKEYKVVFLAGLLEKQFPAEIREDPVLSDEERKIVGLTEWLPRQAVERYFFYLGLTRAQSKIILSYPRFDLEGREALPSFYVEEVTRLFPKDSIPKISYEVSQALPRIEDAVEEREVEAFVVRELFDRYTVKGRERRSLVFSLYNRGIERPSFQNLLSRILFSPAAEIRDERARKMFVPKDGIFKPTGLEIYGRCPFRYFASHVLQLEEKEDGIDARKVGKTLHKVLEDYWTERVDKANENLASSEAACEFAVKRLHEILKTQPLTGEKPYRIDLKVKEMEKWLCRILQNEIEDGSPHEPLRPRFFERKFGFAPKNDYLTLFDPYQEEIRLRGVIDRIDVDPSGQYGLVIDYKTGGSFKFSALEMGTALQLPLYLLVLQKIFKIKPAAGEIYQIKDARTGGFYFRDALAAAGAEVPRSKAVLDQKDFEKILDRAVRFSQKFAKGILRAEIPVRPRECDPHCPFPSVCRIEKWRLKFIEREIREEDRQNGIV